MVKPALADAGSGLDKCASSTQTGARLVVCVIGNMKPISTIRLPAYLTRPYSVGYRRLLLIPQQSWWNSSNNHPQLVPYVLLRV